ncbi:MAG: hypothetical protein J0G30_02395 [Actinomycetales bacterium]|nr:hypothetical protein [Actinomycetales bacterium]
MTESSRPLPAWSLWVVRGVALAGLGVVAWACLTAWGAIVHGHPAYAILLLLSALGCIVGLALSWRPSARRPHERPRRRLAARLAIVALAAGVLALVAWLRPFPAVPPALAAMDSGGGVTVSETATEIVLAPDASPSATGVFVQPGAKVEARAYAALLRPLAEAGHPVVIAKQPLGIAFLAVGAFDAARAAHPEVTGWVLAGHSLGGTVAALEADAGDSGSAAPAVGLVLLASYPASDLSDSLEVPVLSISASRDGLATPEKIAAARPDLPADTEYLVIDGAVHAFFGDYGPQPGDGEPTVSHDAAHGQIAAAFLRFVNAVAAP